MPDNRTFVAGYIQGWLSVVGPRLQFPDIPVPPALGSGSPFIQGLMQGIEDAKRQMTHLDRPQAGPAIDAPEA